MDVRRKKTKETIAKCFLELLRETPVSKITVTKICAMANINRATFYKHYLDIPDLQATLENEILRQFRDFLQSRAFSDNGTYRAMLIELLTLTRQFGGSFYTLCSQNAASDLAARTFQLLNTMAFPILRQKLPAMEEEKTIMLYRYISHGCGSVLSGWLSSGSEMGVEELGDFIMLSSSALVEAAAGTGKEPE